MPSSRMIERRGYGLPARFLQQPLPVPRQRDCFRGRLRVVAFHHHQPVAMRIAAHDDVQDAGAREDADQVVGRPRELFGIHAFIDPLARRS